VQLFSRMNDGLLGACLALSAVFSVPWILRSDRWAAVGVVCPLLLALNLKFSALPLAAGLCALICLFALALRGWRTALRAAQTLGLAGLAGVLVLGAQPYVTNMVRHGHPLFPVMGEVRIDIMNNRPPPLEALSPPQRLAASYFGATSSGFWAPDTHLKPPFTLEKPELKAAGDYDTRLGGFGPFFSGALVLALILGAACGLQKARPPTVTRLLAGAAGLIALGLAMPEAWWARYVPHVWWAVVLVAVAGTVSRPRALRLGGGLLAAVLLVNAGLAAASSAWSIGQRNLDVRRQIAEIGRQSGPVCLYLGDFHARAELLGGLKQKIRMQSALPTHCDPVPLAGASTRHPVGYCPCP
jgi:hypothetical protein